MHINFHIWQDSFTNKKNSFSYDPFLQYYSRSRQVDFEIGNRKQIHFEVKSNISGVLNAKNETVSPFPIPILVKALANLTARL